MYKKDLKMYETPTVEVLDFDLEDQLLAGTNPDDGIIRPKPRWGEGDSRAFGEDSFE